eukprot:gene12512-12646_t
MDVQGSSFELPLYPLPAVGVYRSPRCLYDAAAMSGRVLVIDNGSHSIRAGWAGDYSPSVVFRSSMAKPRPYKGSGARTVVGDWGPGLSGWDFGKHTHRYCFEQDVPVNLEGQEAMFDWALDRLGLTDSVPHPLLLTEAALSPTLSRSQLAQLVFEAYGGLAVRVQLPYTQQSSGPSVGDLAVRAQEMRARGKALADMRRRKMLEEKEEQLSLLLEVQAGVDAAGDVEPAVVTALLAQARVDDRQQLDKQIADLTVEVEKQGRKTGGGGATLGLSVAEQIKVKRRQQLLQAGKLARQRAAERKLREARLREQQLRIEDEMFVQDPLQYLYALQQRHTAAAGRVEARKRRRLGQAVQPQDAEGLEDPQRTSRRRRDEKHRQRMRLLAQASAPTKKKQKKGPEGKKAARSGSAAGGGKSHKGSSSESEEGFGDDDADWQIYREMDMRESDSGEWGAAGVRLRAAGRAFEAAYWTGLIVLCNTDSQINLELLGLAGLGLGEAAGGYGAAAAAAAGGLGQNAPQVPATAEDHQLVLGVERIRVPELLIQPTALAGVDQAGLPEVVAACLRRLPKHISAAVAAGGVILTGGSVLFPGMIARLQSELGSIRPPEHPMPFFMSAEPLLDTWRGAAALAAGHNNSSSAGGGVMGGMFGDPFAADSGALTRAAYEEAGPDYLREFRGFKYPEL